MVRKNKQKWAGGQNTTSFNYQQQNCPPKGANRPWKKRDKKLLKKREMSDRIKLKYTNSVFVKRGLKD